VAACAVNWPVNGIERGYRLLGFEDAAGDDGPVSDPPGGVDAAGLVDQVLGKRWCRYRASKRQWPAHGFERPALRLTSRLSGFSPSGEEPPPRVQAVPDLGRLHWFECLRGDLNPEVRAFPRFCA
jgi:hypothetical protein